MNVWMILLVVAGSLVLAGLVVVLVFLILSFAQSLGGTTGGWRRRAEAYPAAKPPAGELMKRETAKIGAVVYKRCVTLAVTEAGLYLSTWGRSALIPWQAFTGLGHTTLYWQKLPMLTVGEPPIASIIVSVSAFEQLRSRLPETLKAET
jgi:hypothetical protein